MGRARISSTAIKEGDRFGCLVTVKRAGIGLDYEHKDRGKMWEAQCGSSYDVPALLWFLFYLWATRKGWEVPRIVINPKWLLCSEYVHYILTGREETVTPQDIYEWTSQV